MARRHRDEAIWYESGDVAVSVLWVGGHDYEVRIGYEELREAYDVSLPTPQPGSLVAHRAAAQKAMNRSDLARDYAEWTGRQWSLQRDSED